LLEYVEDQLLKVTSPAQASVARAGVARPSAASRPYEVKRGDTLARIAANKLGSAKRWKEIAKLNNIRDPDNLSVGRMLKMP
jgi:5'-nucleotidase